MNPTPAQVEAIQTEGRPLLVRAGAGAGKTTVLVQRFIHLLGAHPDWPLESLVAITFTNKAAREMRTRIRREVERQARDAGSDSHWAARRRELESLQVGTIHSLCARLLRENAIAARVDPRFEMLDEQQAELLQEEAIRTALAELAADDSNPGLGLLAGMRVHDLRDELASLLSQRGAVHRLFLGDCLPAAAAGPPDLDSTQALLDYWQAQVEAMRQTVWQDLLHANPDLVAALDAVAGTPVSDPGDLLAATVTSAQEGCSACRGGDILAAALLWKGINLRGGKKDSWGGKEELAALKGDLKALREAANSLDSAGCLTPFGELDEAAARALHQWRALWLHLNAVYDRLKAERQALDFDDLELLAERLLYLEPRPSRLAAALADFRHVMVDEFQDTNQVQQRIVYALAHPSHGGPLFVVGDAKQSIYRFRQAQVTVFNRTTRDIEVASGRGPIRMDRSFRTHRSLLAALNRLFEQVLRPIGAQHAEFEAPPAALRAARTDWTPTAAAPAPVEVIVLPAQDEHQDGLKIGDVRSFEAQLLARRLLELHEEAFPVWDRHLKEFRPFTFDDAAVLFRVTTSLPLYEEQFKAAGLPYLTVSGRGYYDRPDVRDLIALLACLYNPADDLNLAVVLRSPLFGLSDESLYRLRWHSPEGERCPEPRPFAPALAVPPPAGQPEEISFAARVLDELWGLAGRVEVWHLLRRALDLTGYEAALALRDGETPAGGRRRSNLSKLLDLARLHGGADLSAFLLGLQNLQAREAREGEALGSAPPSGAVQLMSIHAAKGLEFPVVAVADLGRALRRPGSSPRLLHDPSFGLVCKLRDEQGDWQEPASYAWGKWLSQRMDAAESKRLLYVACTRAADLLLLSGRPDSDSWMEIIMETWGLAGDGPDEEQVSCKEFELRVLRPGFTRHDFPASPSRLDLTGSLKDADGARASLKLDPAGMPPLALPLPEIASRPALAVTHLERGLDGAPESLPDLHPVVRASSARRMERRPPAYLLGRVVHRALADWSCLALPEEELDDRVRAFARREGIRSPAALNYTRARARRMLANLRQSVHFAAIDAAPVRRSEVPFTLGSPLGILHGVIDLLYQDRRQVWHLVDWKTEWTGSGNLAARIRSHQAQLAIYALAVRRTLGCEPVVSVCFLYPQLRLHTYSEADLALPW